jgi:hypothetical protein
MSTYLKYKSPQNIQKSIRVEGFGAQFGARLKPKLLPVLIVVSTIIIY